MANFTQGDTRIVLQQNELDPYQANGSAVIDSRRTRPLWFDGRFLAARDLEREQDYFLQRQADLGRSPGFGVLSGLLVSVVSVLGQTSDIITITSGRGITPAGEQVTVPTNISFHLSSVALQPNLDLQLGIATEPGPEPADRTGLFLIGLQPVQYTGNLIAAFPTTIQGTRSTHDGDMIEATGIVLMPYPDPINTGDSSLKLAALARQIFLTGDAAQLPDSILPVAVASLQNGMIQWIDTYLLRREIGATYSGLRFGLTDPATQRAYLQQYDSQLQTIVNSFLRQNQPANVKATDYFQALPPAGRFPLACINTDAFTQSYFPPQMDVRISILPEDEISGLLEESQTLPPIDLTLDDDAYSNLTVFAMIPVPRGGFSALSKSLPEVPITATLPQILSSRLPADLLRFYQGAVGFVPAPPVANASWGSIIAAQTYGFYVRRRSSALSVTFTVAAPPPTTTTAAPTTTTSTPTTTTARPTTTTAVPTTTPAPTTTGTTTTTPLPTTTTTPPPTTSVTPTTTPVTTRTFTIRPTTTRITTFTLFPPLTTIPLTLRPPVSTIPLTLRPPFTIGPLVREGEPRHAQAKKKSAKHKAGTKTRKRKPKEEK